MFVSMLLLGFLLGIRHALEADHVAAVAALATRSRSRGELLRMAAGWGSGHTLTILAMGAVAIGLGGTMSARGEALLERVVGLVLVGMGADVLRRAIARGLHAHAHPHDDGIRHLHFHAHDGEPAATHEHAHVHGNTVRAALMGTLHGLAGSAALLLVALPQAHSGAEAMAYLATFGAGSIGGMMVFSMALSLPLRAASRVGGAMIGLEGMLGSATLLVGVHILSS